MSEPEKILPNGLRAELKELVREVLLEERAAGLKLLTADELAEQLKVPVSWVYEQSRQGKIPTHHVGKYVRFSLWEVVNSEQKKN